MSSLDPDDANRRARVALSLAATLVAASETPGWNEVAERFARIVTRDDPASVSRMVAELDRAVGNDPEVPIPGRDPLMIGLTMTDVARFVFERLTAAPDLAQPLDDLSRTLRGGLDPDARTWAEAVSALTPHIGDDGRINVDPTAVPPLPGRAANLYPLPRTPSPAGESFSETEDADTDVAEPESTTGPPGGDWPYLVTSPPVLDRSPAAPSFDAPPAIPAYGTPPTAPSGWSAPVSRSAPPAPGAPAYSAPPAPGAPPSAATPAREGARPAGAFASTTGYQAAGSTVVDTLRRTLRKGMLMFAAPDVMRQGRKERVEVGIARDSEAAADLDIDFRTRHQRVSDEIRTADFMTVELVGDAFEIRPLSPPTQPVAPTAHWEFEVTPRRSGHRVLTLTATAVVSIDGTERTVAVPAFDRDIDVTVDFGYGTAQFLRGNWQWLVGTLVGLGGALAAWIALFT